MTTGTQEWAQLGVLGSSSFVFGHEVPLCESAFKLLGRLGKNGKDVLLYVGEFTYDYVDAVVR